MEPTVILDPIRKMLDENFKSPFHPVSSDEPKTPEEEIKKWFADMTLTLRNGGCPARYISAKAEDFPTSIQDRIKSLVSVPSSCVFVTGPTGIGKTHLATAIVRAMGQAMRWISVPKLLLMIRGTFGKIGEESEASIVRDYSTARVLLLDDVGVEKISDWSISTLYVIVSERVNELRPTIVTSNLSLADIGRGFDPRLASRLASFEQFHLVGRDRRIERA